MTLTALNEKTIQEIKQASVLFTMLNDEIKKVIVGQEEIITFCKIAILCQGHILLEGVPGVAKTTLIKAFNKALGLNFARIQFTPDLLPSDLIGTLIYNQKKQEFETRKGPIFANLILADEINRAPSKVQAALLEAMQEQQVTIGSNSYKLEKPFLVFATQNPLDQEGTYTLPEAQVDRFLFKLLVTYPKKSEELEIIHKKIDLTIINTVIKKDDVFNAQKLVELIYVDQKIKNYIVDLVFATREPEKYGLESFKEFLAYGVSPRATVALYKASQAHAFLHQRHFVTPDDVKAVAPHILRHRLILTYQAEAENVFHDTIIEKLLKTVSSP